MTGLRENQTIYAVPTVAMAEDIARIHVESWREAYAGIIPGEILANVDMADRIVRWRAYLGADGYPTYLARVEGEPAGFIRTGALKDPLVEGADGHIFALYVLRRFHRRKIGRGLLALAATDWLRRGGRAFSVGVLTENHPARTFYEAMGARFIRPDSYEWDGHALAESIYLFENMMELARFA